ncbi:cytochrome P450 [Mycena latifolia]|nr:cytochrome P450 [Mycena latifolia]
MPDVFSAFEKIFPRNFGAVDAGVVLATVAVVYTLGRRFGHRRSTPLKGPSSSNVFFGMLPMLMDSPDSGSIYEEWSNSYGPVFSVPSILGSSKIVFTDPKAIIHFFNKETYGYVGLPHAKRFLEKLQGKGLFWAEGDDHKRQRKALNPAFSNVTIKNFTPIFFDSGYKAKAAWDAMIESSSSDGAIIEVQQWMNHVSLDTVGLAGFNHDFGSLSGGSSEVANVFDAVGSKPGLMDTTVMISTMIFPIFDNIPTGFRRNMEELNKMIKGLANKFLAQNNAESTNDKSVVGLLTKSARENQLTREEVMAQISVLLMAGYETTAVSLTWALIELARKPDIHVKLREELFQIGRDPTWDELTNGLPFLDAFTCEIFRLYPPLAEISRMAAEDDVLPLSAPIETATGELVDTIFVSKGTAVTMPIQCMNRSVAFWGPDAKVFNPARWLDETVDQHRAQELQGYRHILTFADGPRMCLGKGFALAEFKAVLSVLARNFTFELPKGPETKFGVYTNLLPRPKVEGEDGYRVPLLVRPYAPE